MDNREAIFYSQLGANLRDARIRVRLTQDDFAQGLGVPRSAVGQIENGVQRIAVDQLVAAAVLLRIRVDDLLPAQTGLEQLSSTERDWIQAGLSVASKRK